MPLYRKPDALSALEIKVRVREEYERAVLINEPASVETNALITLGPRTVTYADNRSVLTQMSGCLTRRARLQMAYTMLAVGHIMLGLKTGDEVS